MEGMERVTGGQSRQSMDTGGNGYEHERAWDEHERVWDERSCSCSWQGWDEHSCKAKHGRGRALVLVDSGQGELNMW